MTAVTDRRKDSARRRSSSALLAPARHCGRRTSQVGTKERPLWSKQGRVLAEPGGRPERCCHGRANRQERPDAPTRRCSRRGDPLAQARLDEPLGPIVGARGLGFGADVAQPKGAASLPPMVAAINRAVVGNDALDGDTVAGNSGERAFEKRHRAFLALVAPNLTIG